MGGAAAAYRQDMAGWWSAAGLVFADEFSPAVILFLQLLERIYLRRYYSEEYYTINDIFPKDIMGYNTDRVKSPPPVSKSG